MICPKCEKKISLGNHMKEWDDNFGDDFALSAEFPAMVNIICEHCEESVALIFIEPSENGEEIDSPIGKVVMPKLKK